MKQHQYNKTIKKHRSTMLLFSTCGVLVFVTLLSGIVLSSTTTHAVTKSSTATVNVTMSCTMSISPGPGGTATTDGYSYSATIDPGQYAEINGTIMTTTCTGTGNYSLYAIGNSGNTFDTPTNTQLISSNPSVANIPTGTATSGGTSNWAFKLVNSGSYSPTIISPYNNYASIPGDDYAKIANYIPGTTGSAASSSVQAKYQVYITSTQPAGNYTGKVKYTMVYPNGAPAPSTSPCSPEGTTIATIGCMQDITSSNKSSILSSMTQGAQYRLYDSRDNQQYWVAKQADGNIWMTQNLDLCIGCTGVESLTSENTDLTTSGSAPYTDGYATSGGVITWTPASTATTSSYVLSGTKVSPAIGNDTAANSAPYSVEGGDKYFYTSGSTSNDTSQTLAECKAVSGRSEELCAHYHVGNYYNWTAAIASNASSGIGSTSYAVAANSICPKGWKLPQALSTSGTSTNDTRQFGYLWQQAGITSSLTATSYATNGFNNIRISPLFFVRGGYVYGSSLFNSGYNGVYWSSSVYNASGAYDVGFDSSYIYSAGSGNRNYGRSIRCMVR